MNRARFRQVCETFEAARVVAPGDRDAVVRSLCGDDLDLAAEVHDLLRHHDADAEGDSLAADEASHADPAPGDELNGYRLIERLGEGGMGVVLRAQSPAGNEVAVKILHAHLGLSGRNRERFVREARLGGEVRHPGVVRVLDVGVAATGSRDVPFLVMELVVGQSLRALLDDLGVCSEDLCRHVARELADALAAVHAAGAVHRDVKPDNVLITRDHRVKLTDLGVAHVAGATDALSRTGAFIGSLHYASPEQFDGASRALDGRADLHALGILLYELATGENPFAGGDLATVMRRVLDVEPARLGERNPQVSTFFEEIVHALLEKDRDARFATAALLRDVLDDGEDSAWWAERRADLRAREQGRTRRVRVPRETALYGRSDELRMLDDALVAARDGRGRVILVEGEAGIGKSRLLDEFVARTEKLDVPPGFLCGGYAPSTAAGAAGAVLVALREHFGAPGVEDALAELLPDSPQLVAGLAALVRGDAPRAGEAPLSSDAAESAVVRVVQALAARRPLLLVIDDLHFAPVEGRALFRSLALGVQDHRVLLVGTSRPGLPERFVAGLTALPHVRRFTLGRLGARDLGRLLVDAFRSERLADELGWKLAQKSDGNPFFVFEFVRGLQEGGQLRRGPDGTWSTTGVIDDLHVPSSVLDLIEARLSEVSDDEQEILDVAACCGFEFEPALVAEALGAARIPVLRALGRLERRHALVRASGPRFVFDHHPVQETLYERLSPALRAAYHAVLGSAQERRALAEGMTPDHVRGAAAAQIAGHLLRGGAVVRALAYVHAALDHVEARSRDEAASLCQLALDASDSPKAAERLAILRRHIGNLEHLGRREEHEAALVEALDLARGEEDRDAILDVQARRGWLYATSGRPEEAEALLTAALQEARDEGRGQLVCKILGHLGAAAAESAHFDVARAHFDESLRMARERGDVQLEANALGGLGSAAWSLGDFATARVCDEHALELAREIGDRRREAVAVGNLGSMHTALGEYARSLELQRRRLQISREIGYRRGEAIASGNLGLAMAILGRPDEAIAFHERQIALCREIGHPRGEAAALVSLAAVHVGRQEFAIAEEVCRRGTEAARASGAGNLVSAGEQMLGDILSALGRLDESRDHLRIARELADTSGVAIESVIAVLLAARLPDGDAECDVESARSAYLEHRERLPFRVRMHAEHLMFRLTDDRVHLDEAWTRLQHLRDNAPPEYRESMMQMQPMHRAIAEDVERMEAIDRAEA